MDLESLFIKGVIMPQEPGCLFCGSGSYNEDFRWLNIEAYPPLLFITLFKSLSIEEIDELEHQLSHLFPRAALLFQDRSVRPATTVRIKGDIPAEMIVREEGLHYLIHPERGQNLGFFPDMREGRKRAAHFITERQEPSHWVNNSLKVLNLFSYTCSFSVTALAAGADKVVNIDKNKRSLNIGRKNHRLNHSAFKGGYHNQALFLPHDIFKSMGKLRKEGPYDLIVCDPPPSQKGSFDLNRDYPRLLRRLPEMLNSDGALLLSLNHRGKSWEDFDAMVKKSLPGFSILERIDPPEDYKPLRCGEGLKLLWISRNLE